MGLTIDAIARICHAILFNVLQTYNADYQIPDSGGTATALFCGVKANAWTVGVNDNVRRSNCSNQAENTVDSVLQWAMDEGIFTSCPVLLNYFGHNPILPTRSRPSIRETWIETALNLKRSPISIRQARQPVS